MLSFNRCVVIFSLRLFSGQVMDNMTIQIDDLRQHNLRFVPFDVPRPHVQHLAVAEV